MNQKGTSKTRVFIAWSGERSRLVAHALRDWVPLVAQAADPWMSEKDIHAGARWSHELDMRLGESKFGIICLTPENLGNTYIHFEAGAISKAVENAEKERVVPYLLDLSPAEVTGPLSGFQMAMADQHGTLKLLGDLHAALGSQALDPAGIKPLFEAMWPRLEASLRTARGASVVKGPDRSVEEMVPEILERVRAIERDMPKPITVSWTGGKEFESAYEAMPGVENQAIIDYLRRPESGKGTLYVNTAALYRERRNNPPQESDKPAARECE